MRNHGQIDSSLSKLLARLRFRHLSLLVALDEHRNLHRAAKAVHLAQPSASKLVHDLESVFGSSLFDRLPTGMQPTEFGVVVLAFARRALSNLERLADDLDNARAGRDSHLVIGTTMDPVPEPVAHALAEIKRRRPTMPVTLVSETSDEIISRVADGQVDFAVGYFDSAPHRSDTHYELIGKEALCVLVRRHHPLCLAPSLSVQGLERAPWIYHSTPGFARRLVEQSFARAGLQAPANILESNSIGTIVDLLRRSDALTILPEPVVRMQLQANVLVRLPITVGGNFIGFGILSRRHEPLSPASVEFGQLVRRDIEYLAHGTDADSVATSDVG